MNKLTYHESNGKKVYEIPDEVCRDLLKRGDKALAQCYPEPGKGYAVALLTEKGNVYTGTSFFKEGGG